MLASEALQREVADADARARDLGIGGVPFFIFNGRVALSGAHEPRTILDAIAQAREASSRSDAPDRRRDNGPA
jgi:predicted DsbA family dithiol-disulfide isomerase